MEGTTIYPTTRQALMCLILCQALSDLHRDIHLFRFNVETGEVYILAGANDEIEIIVPQNGVWRFLDETQV
ncbi:DUF6888 family protein [Argonema antarcticum]|uniref:DUF6888 family protein n=1 Tax=Argonema antarcticum TaxID=2942763 RepID=UPI003B8494ED